jgi:hypothetical protein
LKAALLVYRKFARFSFSTTNNNSYVEKDCERVQKSESLRGRPDKEWYYTI